MKKERNMLNSMLSRSLWFW